MINVGVTIRLLGVKVNRRVIGKSRLMVVRSLVLCLITRRICVRRRDRWCVRLANSRSMVCWLTGLRLITLVRLLIPIRLKIMVSVLTRKCPIVMVLVSLLLVITVVGLTCVIFTKFRLMVYVPASVTRLSVKLVTFCRCRFTVRIIASCRMVGRCIVRVTLKVLVLTLVGFSVVIRLVAMLTGALLRLTGWLVLVVVINVIAVLILVRVRCLVGWVSKLLVVLVCVSCVTVVVIIMSCRFTVRIRRTPRRKVLWLW